MINFQLIGFYDAFELTCSLRSRLTEATFSRREDGSRYCAVRRLRAEAGEDSDDFVSTAASKKWVELRTALTRVKVSRPDIAFGNIGLELLEPGVCLPWRKDDSLSARRFDRLHLPLRTNPSAWLYSGGEALSPGVGFLMAVNRRVPCSAINLGDHGRVHLIIDVRKREAPSQ